MVHMFHLIKKLYQVQLLSPRGLFVFVMSLWVEGKKLMAELRFSSKLYPNRLAIADGDSDSTYRDLFCDSKKLASLLNEKYAIDEGKNVALLCRNGLLAVQSLFALSRLGAHAFLLNIDMSGDELNRIIEKKDFDLIIHDEDLMSKLLQVDSAKLILSSHDSLPSVSGLIKSDQPIKHKLAKFGSGSIVVLSGGTAGKFKSSGRKPSIANFIHPFFALLTKMNINNYKSVYIAAPIYHGYGLAALIVSMLIGKETFLLKRYVTDDACVLIKNRNIEIVILLPLMLQRMLNYDANALSEVKCIVTGSAPLAESLLLRTLNETHSKFFNLYGSSEAGFAVMADRDDLLKNPTSIGKVIQGVSIRIVDENNAILKAGEIGSICIKSKWVRDSEYSSWVSTGDLGYMDQQGFVFLCGRVDDMIVSAGENVYPEQLEQVLLQNHLIESAAAIGIADDEFGKRLKAFVVLKSENSLNEEMIMDWLKNKVARYQMPVQIQILKSLPLTGIGKVDKRELARK